MDPTFSHPLWITSGILLTLAGFWLFRWARQNSAANEINLATREAAVQKLLKTPGAKSPADAAKKRASANFRNAMSQFLGIVGFLLIIGGLTSIVLGIFYTGG
jgi:hypothetical protein